MSFKSEVVQIYQLHTTSFVLVGSDMYFASYIWPTDENGIVKPLSREPTSEEIEAFDRFLNTSNRSNYPPLPTQ